MPPTRSTLGKPPALLPYWQTNDGQTVRLFHGDCLAVCKRLPARSVQSIITSPPYWGLRDYGTGVWEGGNPSCPHSAPADPKAYLGSDGQLGRNNTNWDNRHALVKVCRKCGAKRIDEQLGCEPTPAQFVNNMVDIAREWKRILRADGTLWLNLGDCYGPKYDHKAKGMLGMPWKVALALQEDGWLLWQDIIWSKPSPMPESVQRRCTKAHEYIFLLSQVEDYYCDMVAVREDSLRAGDMPGGTKYKEAGLVNQVFNGTEVGPDRNKRSVWTVSSQGYEGAHFATFPPKLITPAVLASTSAHGACGMCGTPYRRIVEETQLTRERPNSYVKRTGEEGTGNSCANDVAGVDVVTVGWEQTCACPEDAGIVPCTILDPFIGSGTTAAVAIEHGRRCWGIDLSQAYLDNNAIVRIKGDLLSRPALANLVREPARAVRLGGD